MDELAQLGEAGDDEGMRFFSFPCHGGRFCVYISSAHFWGGGGAGGGFIEISIPISHCNSRFVFDSLGSQLRSTMRQVRILGGGGKYRDGYVSNHGHTSTETSRKPHTNFPTEPASTMPRHEPILPRYHPLTRYQPPLHSPPPAVIGKGLGIPPFAVELRRILATCKLSGGPP